MGSLWELPFSSVWCVGTHVSLSVCISIGRGVNNIYEYEFPWSLVALSESIFSFQRMGEMGELLYA